MRPMRGTTKIPVCALLLALAPAAAGAQTLHGAAVGLAAGFAHPLAGADHLLAMFAVGLWAAQLGGRALWAVPATFVGSMALGGLLGFAGLHPPLLEPMIAASVLALGLLIAFSVKRKAPGVALIAVFALFHGLAHALGVPHRDSAADYAIGFLAATVLLHVAGVALGLALRHRARLAGTPLALAGGWLILQALSG